MACDMLTVDGGSRLHNRRGFPLGLPERCPGTSEDTLPSLGSATATLATSREHRISRYRWCSAHHAPRAAFSRGGLSSRQAEVLQRSASDPASDIRFDEQFKYIDIVKIHLILFNFASRLGWTEIPLLANNLFECAATIRRPPQNELLCAPNFVFLKNKGYAVEPLRVIKDQTDRLVPCRRRAPAWRICGTKGRFDRVMLVFRRDLDHGCTLEV